MINQLSGFRSLSLLTLIATTLLLGGCGSDMSDLEQWVTDEKAKRVPFRDDLPEIKPHDPFDYAAQNLRSPFMPAVQQERRAAATGAGPKPIENRNREHLENYSLDSLTMVGSLNQKGLGSALVQTPDGLIHRVQLGNYIGENDGRVVAIDDSAVQLIELIPNGIGGYVERNAAIGLSD